MCFWETRWAGEAVQRGYLVSEVSADYGGVERLGGNVPTLSHRLRLVQAETVSYRIFAAKTVLLIQYMIFCLGL